MKKSIRICTIVLALCLVFASLPALAAEVTDASTFQGVMRATDKTSLYSEASTKSGKLASIAAGDAVEIFGAYEGFYVARANGKVGYVEAKRLGTNVASCTVLDFVTTSNKGNFSAFTDAKAKKGASFKKDETFARLVNLGDYSIVLKGTTAVYVQNKLILAVTPATTPTDFVLLTAKKSVYESANVKAKKIVTPKAATLYARILQWGDWSLVVAGDKLGYVQTKDTSAPIANSFVRLRVKQSIVTAPASGKLAQLQQGEVVAAYGEVGTRTLLSYNGQMAYIDTSAVEKVELSKLNTGLMQAKESATIYTSASTKAKKAGTLKKGDQIQSLGTAGTFTIVPQQNGVGYVATKSLKAAAASNNTSGDIRTPYVEIVCTGTVTLYTGPGTRYSKGSTVYNGSIIEYGSTKDGWVELRYGSKPQYIQREFVKESSYTKDSAITSATYGDAAMDLIAHTNAFRKQAGRRELAVDNVLMEAAAIRVIEITQLFAHVRPNGLAPNSIDRSILGENIAMGNPLLTAESAAKGFMSSPGHKDNMLRAGFTKMGAACYKVGGVYYWVQLFG